MFACMVSQASHAPASTAAGLHQERHCAGGTSFALHPQVGALEVCVGMVHSDDFGQ